MAEITRVRQGEMLKGIMTILNNKPEGMPARDILVQLEKILTLTPYEQGQFESGGRRFERIARFSTIGAVKGGWILKQKGRWTLTQEGREALHKFPDAEALSRRGDELYRTWRKNQPEETAEEIHETAEPAEDASTVTLEEAEESAWSEVEQFIQSMNPYNFQDLVAALLKALGYFVVWTAPPGKDGGVDIVAAPDPLGTRTPRIKVQVKRQIQSVAVDGLRSFMATLGTDDVGLFVCTGGFTKDARDEARQQSTRKVTLIDLEKLYDLWVEHSPKLSDEDRRKFPLKPVWFLAVD